MEQVPSASPPHTLPLHSFPVLHHRCPAVCVSSSCAEPLRLGAEHRCRGQAEWHTDWVPSPKRPCGPAEPLGRSGVAGFQQWPELILVSRWPWGPLTLPPKSAVLLKMAWLGPLLGIQYCGGQLCTMNDETERRTEE